MEKLVWEFKSGSKWVTISTHNLDADGNLRGAALSFKENTDLPDGSSCFRQTPQSQIGKGDSTGLVRVLIDVDFDEDGNPWNFQSDVETQ